MISVDPDVQIASSPITFILTGFLSFFATVFICGSSAGGIHAWIHRNDKPEEKIPLKGKVVSPMDSPVSALASPKHDPHGGGDDQGLALDDIVIDHGGEWSESADGDGGLSDGHITELDRAGWDAMEDDILDEMPKTGKGSQMSFFGEEDIYSFMGHSLAPYAPGQREETPRLKDDDFVEELGDILSLDDISLGCDDSVGRPRTPLKTITTPGYHAPASRQSSRRSAGNVLTGGCTDASSFMTACDLGNTPVSPGNQIQADDVNISFSEEPCFWDERRLLVLEL